MSNGKAMITRLTVGLTKKVLCKMNQYFLKSHEPFAGDINVKVLQQKDHLKIFKTEMTFIILIGKGLHSFYITPNF